MAAATRLRAAGLAALLLSLSPAAAQAQADPPLDAQCTEFAEEVISAVLETQPWEVSVLVSRGLPEAARLMAEGSVSVRMFNALGGAFGPLERVEDRSVEVTIANRRGQRTIGCVYRAAASFENGAGVIVLQARLTEGAWRVQSLNVTSVPTPPLPTG